MKNKSYLKNNLRRARMRTGLKQKQVSVLLSKKSNEEISRYERSVNLPNIETALKLEIIYRTPVKLLFQELFDSLRGEINKIKKRQPQMFPSDEWFPPHAEQLSQGEACFYAELLKHRIPNELEVRTVERHVVNLMRVVLEYRSGRNPFSPSSGGSSSSNNNNSK